MMNLLKLKFYKIVLVFKHFITQNCGLESVGTYMYIGKFFLCVLSHSMYYGLFLVL